MVTYSQDGQIPLKQSEITLKWPDTGDVSEKKQKVCRREPGIEPRTSMMKVL